MEQITGLDYKIQEMARRIRELREIEGYTIAEMAEKTDVTAQADHSHRSHPRVPPGSTAARSGRHCTGHR